VSHKHPAIFSAIVRSVADDGLSLRRIRPKFGPKLDLIFETAGKDDL
jgi:hypothetical protein